MPARRSFGEGGTSGMGSVLVMAVWVLFFLGILATAVGAHVSANLTFARAIKDRTAVRYAAMAGVQAALVKYSTDTNDWAATDVDVEKWARDVKIASCSFSIVHRAVALDGLVSTNYGIKGENSKINLNQATNGTGYDMIRSLFEIAGELDESEAVAITDCIADWIDGDDEPRPKGAEEPHYTGMIGGYSCHNERFDDLRELILIKGVTPELYQSVSPHLTIHGTSGAINLNEAGPLAIVAAVAAWEKVDIGTAYGLEKRIAAFREDDGIFTKTDKKTLKNALFLTGVSSRTERREWQALEWLINHNMVTVQSRYFCGISLAKLLEGGPYSKSIAFVFDRELGEIRAWHESW